MITYRACELSKEIQTYVGRTSRGNESPENPAFIYDVPLSRMKILSIGEEYDAILKSISNQGRL